MHKDTSAELISKLGLISRFHHSTAETEETFHERVDSFLTDLIKSHNDKDEILIFCHGFVMKCVAKILTEKYTVVNRDEEVMKTLSGHRANTSIDHYVVSTRDHSIEIKSIGRCDHLLP